MTTKAILTYRILADSGAQGKKSAAIRQLCDEIDRLQKRSTKRNGFTPPTIEQVSAYFLEIGVNGDNPKRFMDFYKSKGWKVGTTRMVDWQAACRNWQRRNSPGGGNGQNGQHEKALGARYGVG